MSARKNWQPVNRHRPCPICGHTHWCRRFDDGAIECMWVESDVPCSSGGHMHWPNGRPGDWRDHLPLPVPPPKPPARQPLDPDTHDRVARRLIELCPLLDHHRANLRGRGLTDQQIAARAYATLPSRDRIRIARTLLAEFGRATMERVPGFHYRTNNQGLTYPTLAGPRGGGLLIPIRDVQGRIIGFQIRRDDDDDAGRGRYVWFSSADLPGGTGSGAPIHVARPTNIGCDPSVAHLLITEGPLKADIAADELDCIVLALPGVSNQTGVLAIVEALAAAGVIIGFDRDAETKTHVLRERDKLAATMAAAQYPVELAVWDDAYKGIDDALVAGVDPQVIAYPFAADAPSSSPRGSVDLPPDAVPTLAARRLRSLREAEAEHERLYRRLILDHEPGITVVGSGTGAGKTYGGAHVLKSLDADWPQLPKRTGPGTRPMRVLYVAQTKEQVYAFRDMTDGLATIVEGRNPNPEEVWGCERHDMIRALGGNRHNPAVDGCAPCIDEHEAIYGKGWLCHFLAMTKATEDARLVAAPFGAYFNPSQKLKNFDVIFVDEGIVPALTETVVLTRVHLADWQRRMTEVATAAPGRYGLNDPFRRFLQALELLLGRGDTIEGDDWPKAMPLLREVCDDLDPLLDRLLTLPPSDELNRYAFETPRNASGHDRLIPLRLMWDLLQAIDAERERGSEADTRLWLRRDGLVLYRVREHLVDILRQKTVINLDASASPSLRRLFPELQEMRVEVPEALRVTQVTDALMSRRQFRKKPVLRSRVQTALAAVTADADAPTIFTFGEFKFKPSADGGGHRFTVSNPATQWGHFDNDTRGLNRFSATDLLCIVGHYSAPPAVLRAEVQGLRFSADPVPANGPRKRLRPYLWRGADGHGRALWTKADPDPDVDELIRWSERSTIIQAIGRGRAARRAADAPLDVVLFTNAPIEGLPIHRLATLAELGATDSRRGDNAAFQAQAAVTAAQSIIRREETDRLVAQTIADLQAEGVEGAALTIKAIADRSGIPRRTLYEPRLRAMIDAARSVPTGVWAGTTHNYSCPVPAHTPVQTTTAEAQRALTAADDAAHDQPAFRQANADLADRLAEIARARGREPVPRPVSGGAHPVAPPPPHLWQRADLPDADLTGAATLIEVQPDEVDPVRGCLP